MSLQNFEEDIIKVVPSIKHLKNQKIFNFVRNSPKLKRKFFKKIACK